MAVNNTMGSSSDLGAMTVGAILTLVVVVGLSSACTSYWKRRKLLKIRQDTASERYIENKLPDLEFEDLMGVSNYSLALVYRGQFAHKRVTIHDFQYDNSLFPRKNATQIQSAVLGISNITFHPNVIQIIHVGRHRDNFMLVSEYCAQGSLYNLINHDHIAMSFGLRLSIFKEAAKAVCYMHSHLILMSPITSKSVFLDEKWQCKVRTPHEELRMGSKLRGNAPAVLDEKREKYLQLQFKCARRKKGVHVAEVEYHETCNKKATDWYLLTRPPEGNGPLNISTATDVYYLGILLYELLSQDVPFEVPRDGTRKSQFESKYKSPLYKTILEQRCDYMDAVKILALLEAAWEADPEARCTAAHLLSVVSTITTRYEPSIPKGGVGARRPSVVQLIKEAWELNFEDIEFGNKLGTGRFGSVYDGAWHGTRVAIKTLPVIAGIADDEATKCELHIHNVLDEIVKEINLICDLRHPHIVSFYGACTRLEHLCIVQEYAPLGSVEDILDAPNTTLTVCDVIKIARGACAGLVYLHALDVPIYHRDLTPRNLLLFSGMDVKLTDFALSTFQNKASTSSHGNLCFTAPELLCGGPVSSTIDVYSFGCVLYNLFALHMPYSMFETCDDLKWMSDIVGVKQYRPALPTELWKPSGICELIANCWEHEPSKRPTIKQVLPRIVSMEVDANDEQIKRAPQSILKQLVSPNFDPILHIAPPKPSFVKKQNSISSVLPKVLHR